MQVRRSSASAANAIRWLVPLPHVIEPTRYVRGTLLVAGRDQLRDEGLYDAYLTHLTPEDRAALDDTVATTWVPFALAARHYAALDELDLDRAMVERITSASGAFLNYVFLSTALNVVRATSVPPKVALPAYARLWPRLFRGGAVGIQSVGRKDARVLWQRHPLLRSRFHKIGLMAHTTQLFAYCAPKHTMREISFDPEDGSIELLFRWV